MARQDHERVAAIFLAALDLEGDARRRYVQEACGGDPDIAREVEALFAQDQDAPPSFLAAERDHRSDGARMVGPYECLRELGRGGQAIVWLARDRRLGRLVALKVLERSGPGSGDIVARFQREAAVASGLRHPGICAVHDAGIADGVAFIAMQYVEGETLAQRISRRTATGTALSADEILANMRIVEALARALHVAHEAGIVHRDMKPGNVMIDRDDQPVILDFGLARQEDSSFPTLTRTGHVFGTPAYMSPEQVSGPASDLDRRTDVWSLGVTLYEALTLRRPFVAPTPERLYQAIVSETPTDSRRHNRAIVSDLDVVVRTAMEKSLSRRYQTALDLAEDLRRIREHEPIRARRPSPWSRITRWTARHPGLAGGLFATFVVLVAGLIVSLLLLGKARSERALSQQLAYRSAIAAAASAAELRDRTALRQHLDESPPELRGWEWSYLRFLLDRSVREISSGREPAENVGFPPDGESLFIADRQGTIEQRDLGTGALMRSIRTTPPRQGPWFVPGGQRALVRGQDDRLSMWDLVSGQEVWSSPQESPVGRLPLTADGSQLVVAVADRPAARVMDAGSGTQVREVPLERIAKEVAWEGAGSPLIAMQQWEFDVADAMTGRVRWSGRGSRPRTVAGPARVFAVQGVPPGRLAIVGYDIADGREMERYDLPAPGDVWSWNLDPVGATVCAGLGSGAIVVWDRGTSVPRDVILAHESGVTDVGFTAGGRWMVSVDRAAVKIWSPDMSASPWIVATPEDNRHGFVNSPDGRRLATTRWGDVVMYDVDEGREIWTRWLTHGTVAAMAFDATSGKIAVVTGDQRLHVLDSGTGEMGATAHMGGTQHLVWAGSRLFSGQRDGVHLIDGTTFSETGVLACPSRVTALIASRNASTIAIGLENGDIRVQRITGTSPALVLAGSPGPFMALAFSRDGRLLAGSAGSGSAAVWDVATGRRVSTLAGAQGGISTLVFDPSGEAVAGGDEGNYIRVWDVASGFERLVLRPSAFRSPAVSSWWDEAMLRFSERENPIVAFETRAPPGGFERREQVRRSRALVNRLSGSGASVLPAAEVVARIESDVALSETTRRLAIVIARGRGDDLNRLNGHAWEAVLWPDRPAGYERALRQASEVCRQQPGDWPFLNSLALAQHRAGNHAEACKTLDQCEQILRRQGRPLHPSDLAIMAMAEHGLGRSESARSRLEAARTAFFAPSFGRDEETLQLIREAEALIGLPDAR